MVTPASPRPEDKEQTREIANHFVMEEPMELHKEDERFAWNAALAVMAFFSLITVILRFLGLFPFQDVFALALVGIPTLVLLLGRLTTKKEGC